MDIIDIDALIQASYELDPLPGSLSRLAGLVAQGTADIDEIERVVALDAALLGRVLRAANSAASAAGTVVMTARGAVVRLGTASVLSLAIGARVGRRLQREVPQYGLAPGQLFRHSVASALAVEALGGACRAPLPAEATAAALLHDIGKVVLCHSLTPTLVGLLQRAYAQGWRSLREAETEILGVHHGEVGGLIAQHWRLPAGIVQGITHHHLPEVVDLPVAYAVQLADEIARAAEDDPQAPPRPLPDRALQRLGMDRAAFPRCVEDVRARLPAVAAAYD